MKINNVSNVQSMPQAVNRPEQVHADTTAPSIEGLKPVDKSPKQPIKEEVVDEEMMKKSIEQANKSLKQYNRKIERSVHEVTHTVMYQLKDVETDEVIREFPPKKIQDMIAKMWELAGLFVDEKA